MNKLNKIAFLFSCLLLGYYAYAESAAFFKQSGKVKAEVDGIFYSLDTVNHTAFVSCKGDFYYLYDEYTGSIAIPSKITYKTYAYRVIGIEKNAFNGCKQLESVIIPQSIRMIGVAAFKNCSSLRNVKLPDNLEVIRHEAFANCTNLTSVNIPLSVHTICDNAFQGCTKLTVVNTLAANISETAFASDVIITRNENQENNKAITKKDEISISSDVDINIPQSEKVNDHTVVVIIANEHYEEVEDVSYALHDGEIVSEYCKKTLGIPSHNIRLVKDATLNNIHRHINWLVEAVNAFEGEANGIVYYSGHGIPDVATKAAYLLPVDGYGTDVRTAYKLDELYAQLGNAKAKSMTVFLDACFSGSARDGGMIDSARGVAIRTATGKPQGRTVVFAAATNDETAYPNPKEGHGMFTYHLLKKLQETAGNVTYEELATYVKQQVQRQSVLLNGKSQTPTVNASAVVGTEWNSWTLKH